MEEIKTVIDNTKDWYDLADTALKIGLGALIAGGFTYIITKVNHSHENKKNQYELKKQLLLEVNELSSKYFLKISHLFSIWGAPTTKNKFLKELSAEWKEEYTNNNISYNTRIEELEKIYANLNLLEMEESFNIIAEHDQLVSSIRIKIYKNEITFPIGDEDFMDKVRSLKKQYNKSLGTSFWKLK